jgi:hypothetical protein
MKQLTFVSLFAGVGGFDLGFEQAGMKCVGQVEIDKHCQKVLQKHWPDVPLHDDVTTATDWANEKGLVGNVDIVCGGFPCQDVSVAGRRAGIAGARSGLFWDAIRLLGKSKHTRSSWRMCRDYFQATKAATSESLSLKWPTQGIATSSGEFWIRSSSEFPNAAVESSLLEVLEKTSNPRYFLSSKACEGILRRANRRGKVLPKALEDALVHQSQQSQE